MQLVLFSLFFPKMHLFFIMLPDYHKYRMLYVVKFLMHIKLRLNNVRICSLTVTHKNINGIPFSTFSDSRLVRWSHRNTGAEHVSEATGPCCCCALIMSLIRWMKKLAGLIGSILESLQVWNCIYGALNHNEPVCLSVCKGFDEQGDFDVKSQ